MKNSLILFTANFPYGTGEEFLETEIIYLARAFKNVYILPYKKHNSIRLVPSNVTVVDLPLDQDFQPVNVVKNNIYLVFKVLFHEVILSDKRLLFLRKFKYYLNNLIWRLSQINQLEDYLFKINCNAKILYSYWFNDWVTLLSIIRIKSKRNIKILTRIHGYDYDMVRRKDNFIPFRQFEMNQVTAIFSISSYGIRQIQKQYPSFKELHLARLGTSDHGTNVLNEKNIFHIVSCSSLIKLKRVDLIIKILKSLNFPVKWTHIGDGPLLQELIAEAKTLPSNIENEFKGHLSNTEVIDFYKTTSINLFINTSEIEGIPVSIMEALSFGIPCIACDVGGIPEIITSDTGYLIQKEFEPLEVAKLISAFSRESADKIEQTRLRAKTFWKENFSAAINYESFTGLLQHEKNISHLC